MLENKEESLPIGNSEKGTESNADILKEYEEMLQRFEEESRNHIGIEQQLKLHIEILQEKMEESNRSIDSLKAEFKAKSDECKALQEELAKTLEKYKQLQQAESVEDYTSPFITIADQSRTQGSTAKHGRSQDFISKFKRDSSKKVTNIMKIVEQCEEE
eukprot:TRINITY_DN12789_c0_g2_i1.p1 TRINITY_DN12789_c0_g2~~TRINITY_DN12789_c0_g2_i1.p1  ORF type:complete len:159 (+),score=46.00 TRINITY_DN12789_c0_g2_i1:264-740(+)